MSLVEIRDLSRSFTTGGGQIDVLKGLDLDIAEGDRVAIVGQSTVSISVVPRSVYTAWAIPSRLETFLSLDHWRRRG